MNKHFSITLIFFSLLLWYTTNCNAQIIYGANNFTEYHIGSLPIIISAPHGGSLSPASIPDRTCNNPTTAFDIYTIELANQIDSSLFKLTGARPHLIHCNLKRTKVDCNRNISDGACGDPIASNAWNEFHNFIDTAENIAKNQFQGKAFYIDLHGHGHTIQQLELGYLLTAEELALSDSLLNTTKYINYSSIQNLVKVNQNALTHSELLRGDDAFGTLLANAGYPSVPSKQNPSPGNNPYFSGGYNTANYSSYFPNETTDGVQIETNFNNVRDTQPHRAAFADSIALVLVNLFKIHYDIDLLNTQSTQIKWDNNTTAMRVFPTSIFNQQKINLISSATGTHYFSIFNTLGQTLESGQVMEDRRFQLQHAYQPGIYLITIQNNNFQQTFRININ